MSIKTIRVLAIAGGLLTLIAGLLIGGGKWSPAPTGLPDAGQSASWLRQVTFLLNTGLGIIVLGALIRLAFLRESDGDELRTQELHTLRRVNGLAGLWSLANIFAGLFTLQYVLGLTFSDLFSPGIIGTYLLELAPSRSFIVAAIFALAIAFISAFVKSLNSVLLLVGLALAAIITPLLNSHSASLGDHSLAITSSVAHGIAMSAWVGTLWAITSDVRAGDQNVISRFSTLATIAVTVLVISGVAASYARLDSFSDLWTSGYGRLVVIKTILFLFIAAAAQQIRRSYDSGISLARLVSTELVIMAMAIGFGVALHGTPLSRAALELPSAAEEILGFAFPGAPTFISYVFGWHPEWTMLSASLVALALYLTGVRRLIRENVNWPIMRTVSFTLGIALVAWATSSGISKYAMISFASHMIQHMMLSMLAPIFLVLGAPITLALRALPTTSDHSIRNARQWIISLLHSRYAMFIGHPLIVLAIFTFGLYGMYFTPLFGSLMSSHTGHLFMEVHFLLSGALFAFIVVGVDPAPREIPAIARLLLVLVAISLHAFFAIAIMQSTVPIGNSWYSQVRPPWISNPLDDTYTGGGIAWAIGEIPSLVLMVLVAVQWARSDAKLAARQDRQADRDNDTELNAYNEYLAQLNKKSD